MVVNLLQPLRGLMLVDQVQVLDSKNFCLLPLPSHPFFFSVLPNYLCGMWYPMSDQSLKRVTDHNSLLNVTSCFLNYVQ